jgi:chromate transporter
MIYLLLFWEFFKTGLLAVGGGLATLPFLSNMADTTGWFTHSQLADMVAVSESTPGPMGVNMATYVGYTTAGIPGALIATLGLITPSIIVILIIAGFLKSFRDNRFVNSVFLCLRPASTGLIVASGLSVAAMTFFGVSDIASITLDAVKAFDWKSLVLAVILLVVTRWIKPTKKLHPIVWILASAVVGVVFSFAGV